MLLSTFDASRASHKSSLHPNCKSHSTAYCLVRTMPTSCMLLSIAQKPRSSVLSQSHIYLKGELHRSICRSGRITTNIRCMSSIFILFSSLTFFRPVVVCSTIARSSIQKLQCFSRGDLRILEFSNNTTRSMSIQGR